MRGFWRRPGPRLGRPALAAGAGLVGDLLLLAVLWIVGAVLSGAAYPFGGGPSGIGVLLAGVVFSAGVLGGTLPAVALGCGWASALAASFIGHSCATVFVFGALVPLQPFDGWPAYLGAELALAVALAGLLWGARVPRGIVALTGSLLAAVVLTLGGVFYGLLSAAVGLLAWVLLPTIAALLLRACP